MIDVLIGIISNFFWFLIGIFITLLYRFIFRILPAKRLWSLNDPNSLIICAATSTRTHTGTYVRLATGLGQLRALGLIVSSLNRAYKKIQIKNVLLSDDQIDMKIENDIILLGGPKNNRHTKRLLEKLNALSKINQVDDILYWKYNASEEKFIPDVQNEQVVSDYGLIVKMNNPFSSSRSMLYLFSGGHTYGTIASARYFTEVISQSLTKRAKNFIAIVSCDVVDKFPVGLKLEKYQEF